MKIYKTLSDEELVKLLKRSNHAAFTEIFERYHRPLYLNIMRIMRNEQEAEDLLQMVFEILWNKRSALDEEKSIGGWLFTLSCCRTIDFMRLKIRERKNLKQAELLWNQHDQGIIFEEHYARLEKVVAELSPQKRRVFEKCKLEGKTYEKAALELGISKYTVAEYLKDSMAYIKKEMTAGNTPSVNTVITFALMVIFFS